MPIRRLALDKRYDIVVQCQCVIYLNLPSVHLNKNTLYPLLQSCVIKPDEIWGVVRVWITTYDCTDYEIRVSMTRKRSYRDQKSIFKSDMGRFYQIIKYVQKVTLKCEWLWQSAFEMDRGRYLTAWNRKK